VDDRQAFHDWLERRHPDPRPLEQRIRAAQRRQGLVGVLTFVVAVPAAVLAVAELPESLQAAPAIPSWQAWTGMVLLIAGAVGGLVWVARPSRWSALTPGSRALSVLPRGQKQALRHQVLGKIPFVRDDLPAARVAARDRATLAPGVAEPSPYALVMLGVTVGRPSMVFVTLTALGICWMAVSLLILRRRFATARRFLAEHAIDMVPVP
jgi:hypothetical protein